MNVLRYVVMVVFIVTVHCDVINGVCTMEDDACEFYLTVSGRMKMWRGFQERVYINNTDCKAYVYGTNNVVLPEEVILADGTDNLRILTVVNGTMPGPTLTMYENQEITVHVTNKQLGGNVAIHWHGLVMKNTPWMDGAAFITQCPILPGQTFTYKFKADRAGTHFYQAQTSGISSNSVFGPLIVKKRIPAIYQEHIMTIQNFNNKMGTDELQFLAHAGSVNDDGTKFMGHPIGDGSQTTTIDITSSLINGRGRVYDRDGAQLTCTPLPVFEVQQGQSYRFRVINAASAYQSIVSVDGHKLFVLSIDGHDVEPVSVDKIMSHSGERVDFMLTPSRNIGNFWIRMESVVSGRFSAFAILRYVGAPTEEPATGETACTTTRPCTYFNCPFTSKSHITCINVEELKSSKFMSTAPAANPEHFREIFLNIGHTFIDGTPTGHMNGVSLQLPTVSALTQHNQIKTKCSEELGCGVRKACRCTSSLDIQLGDVIQFNLLNLGSASPVHYPIHIHGYNFHVLKMGYRPTNDSFADFGTIQDVNCKTNNPITLCNDAVWADPTWNGGNIPDIELARAPLKDTLVVPAGGYAVIRFVVDNPGLWFLHSSINVNGMGILLNDSFANQTAPPRGFPTCGDFEPMTDEPETSTSTSTSTTTTTAPPPSTTNSPCQNTAEFDKDTMFTREEFWFTTSGLLIVVFIQFMVVSYCLTLTRKRDKNSFKSPFNIKNPFQSPILDGSSILSNKK